MRASTTLSRWASCCDSASHSNFFFLYEFFTSNVFFSIPSRSFIPCYAGCDLKLIYGKSPKKAKLDARRLDGADPRGAKRDFPLAPSKRFCNLIDTERLRLFTPALASARSQANTVAANILLLCHNRLRGSFFSPAKVEVTGRCPCVHPKSLRMCVMHVCREGKQAESGSLRGGGGEFVTTPNYQGHISQGGSIID